MIPVITAEATSLVDVMLLMVDEKAELEVVVEVGLLVKVLVEVLLEIGVVV